jgi:hypothetical protein
MVIFPGKEVNWAVLNLVLKACNIWSTILQPQHKMIGWILHEEDQGYQLFQSRISKNVFFWSVEEITYKMGIFNVFPESEKQQDVAAKARMSLWKDLAECYRSQFFAASGLRRYVPEYMRPKKTLIKPLSYGADGCQCEKYHHCQWYRSIQKCWLF